MFQESEVINLLMAIIALGVILFTFIRGEILHYRFFFFGFLAMISGYFFTVIEGIGYTAFFDAIEHISYAVSGFFFMLGVFQLHRQEQNRDRST